MELTTSLQKSDQFKFLKSRNSSLSPKPEYSKNDLENDTIDVTKIHLSNDESWLCSVNDSNENHVKNLQKWLHSEIDNLFHSDGGSDLEVGSPKNIDTRTFTRPKKRFTRPSIEKYNEEVYGNHNDGKSNTSLRKSILYDNLTIQESSEPISSIQPLTFDLSQPTNSYYFENILANSGEIDSFQNMSPPSLVNSMCSSTFANLMESSFIKNDPILREIRDTDYTDAVLLQDFEPPMFQSITESCSSINSDTAENFLRKISFNGTYKNASKEYDKTVTVDSVDNSNNDTIEANNTNKTIRDFETKQFQNSTESSQQMPNFNGTYRRTPKQKNGTFRKSDYRNKTVVINSTFEVPSNEIAIENTTQTFMKDSNKKSFDVNSVFNKIATDDTIEDMKKGLSDVGHITDLNRLSYCLEDENVRLDSGYIGNSENLNTTETMKRSSIGCSTGSADSLDRMSSLSNSSRESSKVLNMADVDSIVEMQEKSLRQVFSTPNKTVAPKKLIIGNSISPILNEPISDSDVSSNEEYKSVKSTASKTSLDTMSSKAKSLGYLAGPVDTKVKPIHRSTYTLASQKPLPAVHNKVPGSYSNMQKATHTSSQTNLYRPSSMKLPSSGSNLKNMRPKLKGSYTSLRPMSANLPVAPPINTKFNTTTVLPKADYPKVKHNIEPQKKGDDKGGIVGDHTFVKPNIPKTSGLPRPTGIPRPPSRIPGPRTSKLRPALSKSALNKQDADF